MIKAIMSWFKALLIKFKFKSESINFEKGNLTDEQFNLVVKLFKFNQNLKKIVENKKSKDHPMWKMLHNLSEEIDYLLKYQENQELSDIYAYILFEKYGESLDSIIEEFSKIDLAKLPITHGTKLLEYFKMITKEFKSVSMSVIMGKLKNQKEQQELDKQQAKSKSDELLAVLTTELDVLKRNG